VCRLVGSHYFLAAPSRSLVLQSNQSALSVTWASSSTVILAPPPMYVEPCLAVSPHCDSFVIYIATSPTTAFALSWSRSSTLGSITATSCLSDFLPISNDSLILYNALATAIAVSRHYNHAPNNLQTVINAAARSLYISASSL